MCERESARARERERETKRGKKTVLEVVGLIARG